MIVEGLAAWLARADDAHADARELRKKGKILTLRENQLLLRQTDEHETLRAYRHGKSFVTWLIDTYGFEKFGQTWKRFNITVNSPEYKIANTKGVDWDRAFTAAFQKGIGTTSLEAEKAWRAFLSK